MPTYAAKTDVTEARSRDEIERTLRRYGASEFMYGWTTDAGVIGFRVGTRMIRITVPMPNPEADEFRYHSRGLRTQSAHKEAYHQAVRSRWRSVALVVKAKLQAVEDGISTLDAEFMAFLVLPTGRTVAEEALPQIELAIETGRYMPLLPMLDSRPALPAPKE